MKRTLALFFLLASFSLAFAQMSVPTLSTPTDGSQVNSLSTTLYWNSVSCNYYDYQCDTTANFDSPLLMTGSRSSSYRNVSISGLRMETTYYWRVRARSYSDTSAWSPARTFSIPGLTVTAPADGITVTSPYVYIDYTLPSGAYLYYELDTVPTFDSPFYTTQESSSFTLTRFGKTYYWRVRAYANGGYTPWTETRTVTLSSAGPQLYSPSNNSVTSSESVELYWQNDFGLNMLVQYDTVATFDSPMLYETTTTSSYIYTQSFPSGTRIYWRVKYNDTDNSSDWSEVWSFVFRSGVQPYSPVNGETVNSLYPSLTFTGRYGYYVNYEVRCDTVPTFDSPALRTDSYSPYYSYTGDHYSCSVSGLTMNKLYYWQVRFTYDGVTSDWSETETFRTPSTIALYGPQNGSEQSMNVELSWSDIDGIYDYVYLLDTVPTFNSSALVRQNISYSYGYTSISVPYLGATYYWKIGAYTQNDTCWSEVWNFHVSDQVSLSYPANESQVSAIAMEFSWNSLGSSYVFNLDTVATFDSPALVTSSVYDNYNYVEGLKFGQQYYWRVRSSASSNAQAWSDTWTFTTASSVTPTSPTDGSSLSYNEADLYWNSYSGIEEYVIEFDTVSTFNSAGLRTYTSSYTDYYVSSLEYLKTYYWRVKARYGSEESDWSRTMSFNTPGAVVLYSPSNGSTVSGISSVYFNWSSNYSYYYTQYYQIQYDTIADFSSPLAEQSLRQVSSNYVYLYDFEPNKTYYWRVGLLDNYNYTLTGWSATWSFNTNASITQSSPADGSTLDYFYTYLNCNVNNLDGWIYQLDTTESFNSAALRTGNDYDSYLGDLTPGTTYYWRVAGYHGTDTLAWSDAWSFSTTDGLVHLISPTSGTSVHSVSQYLTWENIPGCDSYEYQCDTVSTFDSPALIVGTRNHGYNYLTLNDLYYERTHYWRVRSIINGLPAEWSEVWTFTTVSHPELAAPATGTTLNYTYADLSWNAIQGSRSYQYQYDTTATFNSAALQTGTTSSTYAYLEPLYYGTVYHWRVRAIDNRDTSDWSDAWTFTTPGTVTLNTPENGSAMTGVSGYFYWTGVSANTYLFQMDTVSTFDSPFLRSTSTYDYSAYQSNLPYGATLYWRVAAVNSIDQSDWSEVWTVTTPANITLSSPEDQYTLSALSTSLYWQTCAGTNYYQYQFDTVPTFNSAELISSTTSSTSTSVNYLHYGKTYYWRVRGYHYSDTSAWSDTWTFSTPAAVTLVSPYNGATDIASTVSLTWNQITNSTSYEYQYDTVATFDSPAFVSGTRGSSYNYVSVSNLTYNTQYYWRVRAINYNVPDTSAWSEVFHFQTSQSVTLSSPADGTVSTTIANSLSWNQVYGSSYIYNIDTVSTFDSPALQSGSTYSTSYYFDNLYYGTTYYWRVAAYNDNDTTVWSNVWSFTTPSTILLNTPENDLVINTLSQNLSWYSCDGTSYYEYQFDTVPTFDSPALRYSTTYSTSVSVSNLCFESRIYWRVRGWNYVDTSDWSETRYFNTENAMTLSLPANDSILSIVNPQIRWNTYSGASNYQYQYDTTATFDSPLLYTGTTSSLYRSLSYLQYGADYYWRVRAYHSYDSSAWSPVWHFTTPANIALDRPVQDSTLNTLSPTLYWNTCSGTSTYEYQYDTVATFDSPLMVSGTRSSSYNYVSISGLQYDTEYFWRVRGWHSADTSDWSDVWSFNTTGVVTLLTPEDGTVSTSISNTITWQSIGSSNYIYDLDTVPTFDSPVRQMSSTSSTSRSFSNLYYGKTYYWRVAAYANGDTTVWSDVWTFTTPANIELSTPEIGTENTTLSQYFYWNTCTGTNTYEYQLDTVPTFDSPAAFSGTRSSSYNYVSLSNLFYENDIYWHVRCINSVDTSDWSDTWYITTTGRMQLNAPADSTDLTLVNQTLSWNSYPGTSYYEYQYDTTANFNSSAMISGTTSSTSYSVSNLYFGADYYWRVRAVNSRDMSAWSDVWHFSTPAAVTLQSPEDESTISTVSQQLRWETIGNSITYQLQYDTSATFTSPILVTYSTSSTYYTASNLCYGAHYYWRVRATNNVATSDWSDVWEFNTQGTVTLISPENGTDIPNINTSITWSSFPGTSSYQYQYDTVPTFDSPLASMISTSSTSASLTGLQYGKTYYWHVRAINSANASAWSETWTFNTPGDVTLSSPENGSVATSISNTLYWNSISGSSSYMYEIDTVPTFDSPVYASNTTSSTSYSLNNLYFGTTYYWHVKAQNANSSSEWSDTWTFTTPARTTLSSPEDGTQLTTLSQYFYWNTLNGTSTYEYQLDTVPTFDSPAAFSGTRSSSYSYVSLSNLFFESTIYWRVRCINSVDTSDWSDVWTVNTVGQMTLNSPADGTAITGVSQSISWNSYSGATRYEYQYDTTATFTSPIVYSSTTTSTSTSISNLAYDARYYWHVRAINSRDTSAWSDVWSFTTPFAVALVSPVDGYVSASVSNSLQWTGISGSSYLYELDTVTTFDSPLYYSSTTSSTSVSVSALHYGKTYYWRVAAINNVDTSAWSDVWSFTTPARTTLSSPTDGTQLSGLSQYFYWNTLSGTNTYEYQLDTVPTFDSPAAFSGTRSSSYNYVSLNNLFFESTIYWHVRCINSVDTSDWSDTWTVITTGNMTLSSPYDSTELASTSTYLYWNSYYGANNYQYECDTTATFDSPVVMSGITSSTSSYVSGLQYGVTYYWHVRAVNTRDSSAWSDTWTFVVPNTLTLISPADESALSSVSTSFSWSGINNSSYMLQKDTVPTFNSPALTINTTSSTSISLSNLYYGTTHYWRVAAYNSNDTTAWSDVWSLTTPAQTTLSSPADGSTITSLSQTIYWNTLSGTNTYQYEYDTVPTFNSPALRTGTASSYYNYQSINNLCFESTIYWHVRCINSVDTSDWSDTWHFTTIGSMTLISPADNSTVSATSATLTWSSYSGASGYVYEYDTDSTFSQPISGYSYYTNASISGLQYGTTYYWRARAVNSYDSSAWSDTWRFTTPSTITLSSPADQTIASGTDITLQWNGISGSDYIYEIDTVATFNSPYRMTGTSYYTSYSLYSLYYGTTYYWRVAATNGNDTTAWSPVWSFTTPSAVTLSSPADGSVTYSTSQYLYWNSISGSYYRYEIDENPNFNSPNLRTGTTYSTSQYISGLAYGNTYYWRIQAYNDNDEAEWSNTWHFTVQSSLFPMAPTLISPANGSTNVAVNGRLLTWTFLSNATSYEVQLGTDSTFASAATYTVYGSNYLMNGLQTNTIYYWRVRGASGSSEFSPWSDAWHFTTSNCSLYAPTDIISACESYTWRGQTFTQSGAYRDTVFRTDACDSIYVLSLTIYHNVHNDITISTTGSYTWNGVTYNTSGNYTQNFTTVNGCDSTVTLHLTITTGIADNGIVQGLKVYPNPTTGEFTVHTDGSLISEIRVYDMVGKLVMAKAVEGDDTQLDLSQSNPGMYILRLVKEGQLVGTSKIVLTR